MRKAVILVITLIMSAFIFTSCYKTDPYELYNDIGKSFDGKAILSSLSGKGIEVENVMTAAQTQKMKESFKKITLNGSMITLPVMVCDLPEEFTVQQGTEAMNKYGYRAYVSELMENGKELCTVLTVKSNKTDFEHAVIVAMIINGDVCSWTVGDVQCSFDHEHIEEHLGAPSAAYPLLSESEDDYIYAGEDGDCAVFRGSCSFVMLFSLDCSALREAGSLCRYGSFDYFEADEPCSEIVGENIDFDAAAAFEEDALIIGKFKSPLNPVIGELGEEVFLKEDEMGVPYSDNYLKDSYFMYLKNRRVAYIHALRSKDEDTDKAVVCDWTIMYYDLLKDSSVMGIPMRQSGESLSKVYSSVETDEYSYHLSDYAKIDDKNVLVVLSKPIDVSEGDYMVIEIY